MFQIPVQSQFNDVVDNFPKKSNASAHDSPTRRLLMLRIQRLALLVFLLSITFITTSWAAPGSSVTVMTKNMDTGTDFGFFFAYLQTNPALGAQLTWEELQKNDFAGRAVLLAQEIATAQPAVVGLQEVTLLRVGPTPATATNVVMDQLDLLLGALAALGRPYTLVTTQDLTDLAFPLPAGFAARFTDRDAIIARADLAGLSVSNTHQGIYQTLLSFSGITAYRGWLSADVTVGTNSFRFVATHLESSGGLYGNPDVDLIQAAQAAELAATFSGSSLPVAIAADFNSNAARTPPEQTLSYGIMLNAGFTDSWRAVYRGNPGFTWPLYVEDPLRPHPQGPFERIDYVFAQGLTVQSADRTGLRQPSSDHAGVVATLGF
jgi:hypothetical protein